MGDKKALIVGGSSGIGASIAAKLMAGGYFAIIADKNKPDEVFGFDEAGYEWIKTDLSFYDKDIFEKMADDPEIEILFITAGFGRVGSFESFPLYEIDTMVKVNTIASIKLLSAFYHRLSQKEPFFCGVMGSISGLVSSPLISVYAATKAAVCRFTESINIELEMKGTQNRILNVSPGVIKGTEFYGGSNRPKLNEKLAAEITDRMFGRETLWIPEYESVYKSVIDRYQKDPHKFGTDSYSYKVSSGRVNEKTRMKIGYMSGTFDLFHIGHLNLIKNARANCDYLIVGVHSDGKWKGKETFIPLDERKNILSACLYVDDVVDACVEDSDAWELYHYDRLFVGSDYKGSKRFERYESFFRDKNVDIIYFPYTKSTSSTKIRDLINAECLKEG